MEVESTCYVEYYAKIRGNTAGCTSVVQQVSAVCNCSLVCVYLRTFLDNSFDSSEGERAETEEDFLQGEVQEAHPAQGDTVQEGQGFTVRPRQAPLRP